MLKPQLLERFTKAELFAVKSLFNCKADEHQQKIALDWIIYKLCQPGNLAFKDTDRETCLALGKQYVGLQLLNMWKLDPETDLKKYFDLDETMKRG